MSFLLPDPYPSRLDGEAKIIERADPVVHGIADDATWLNAGQLSDFERDGYLFLPNLFTEQDVETLRVELERLRTSERVRQSEIAITEPMSGEIRSIFAVETVSDVFARLAADPRLVGMTQQILGSEVYLHQTRANLKPGFRGKEFYWHSDFETWHCEDGMPRMRALSCSIALTDNLEFNGPLMLIPGSHKHFVQCAGRTPANHHLTSLKKQDYGVPSDEHLTWLAAQREMVAPKGRAGSVVLFDCNTMHGSNSNITPYPRSNLFFVYNSVENALEDPFAAESARPWFLANRTPSALTAAPFLSGAKNELAHV